MVPPLLTEDHIRAAVEVAEASYASKQQAKKASNKKWSLKRLRVVQRMTGNHRGSPTAAVADSPETSRCSLSSGEDKQSPGGDKQAVVSILKSSNKYVKPATGNGPRRVHFILTDDCGDFASSRSLDLCSDNEEENSRRANVESASICSPQLCPRNEEEIKTITPASAYLLAPIPPYRGPKAIAESRMAPPEMAPADECCAPARYQLSKHSWACGWEREVSAACMVLVSLTCIPKTGTFPFTIAVLLITLRYMGILRSLPGCRCSYHSTFDVFLGQLKT